MNVWPHHLYINEAIGCNNGWGVDPDIITLSDAQAQEIINDYEKLELPRLEEWFECDAAIEASRRPLPDHNAMECRRHVPT